MADRIEELAQQIASLEESELEALFQLPNIDCQKASGETVAKYQRMGCKLGDAVICAHLEELNVKPL